MAANITQNMLDKLANQAQYSNPQLKGLSNMVAKMFGAESLDTLPSGVQNFMSQIMYVMANNYGDQMGLLNMGNLYANMHQGVVSSGAMPAMGMNGSLLGVSRGAGARSATLADMYSQIAQQYYMTGNGATITDHTHGMSANMYTGLAGAVLKDRGVQKGDSKILRTQKGYQGIKMALDEIEKSQGKEGAIDKGSNEYKALVDLSRVTKAYDEAAKGMKQTPQIQKLESEIDKLDAKERSGVKLTDEEKRSRTVMSRDLSRLRQERTKGIKAGLQGRDLGEETINGQKFGKLRMTEDMIDMAAEQYNNGGTQSEMMTTKARKEVQEAIRKTSKNVSELEKIFGTNDFAELQNIAKTLGMGSISDMRNVEQVTKRIREAQVMAQKTGRSIQSIFTEQGALLGTYSQIYGGESRVNAKSITFNQRVSSQVEEDTKTNGGRGATKEEASAEIAASEAAYMDETSGMQLLKYNLNDNKLLTLTPEQRKKAEALMQRYKAAEARGDYHAMAAIEAEANQWNAENGDTSESAKKDARTKHGHDFATGFHNAVAVENLKTDMSNLGAGQKAVLAKEGINVDSEKTQNEFGEVFNQLDNKDMAGADEIANLKNEKDREAAIQGMLDSSGLTGDARKKYEDALRKYVSYGSATRQFLRREGIADAHMATRVSAAGEARMAREVAIADLKTKLSEGGELPKSGMASFTEGLLAGDNEVTDRDVVLSSLASHGFYNKETGAVDQEAINRLNNDPEMSKSMFALSVDEKTGALKNTDILEKEIQGPDGKKMPMWKLLGDTKEEAYANAKDPSRVNDMMNTLSNDYGLSGTSIGGGNVVFAEGASIQKGREELENTRKVEGDARKLVNALGDHISDFQVDKDGNIVSAKIDGEDFTSPEKVNDRIAYLARKNPALARKIAALKDTKQSNTKAAKDSVAMQEYGKFLMGGKGGLDRKSFDSDANLKNEWSGSAADIANWGTEENFNRQKEMRQTIADMAKDVKGADLEAAKRKYFASQGFSGDKLEEKVNGTINSAQMMEILMTGKGANGQSLLSGDKRDKLKSMYEENSQLGDGGMGTTGGEGLASDNSLFMQAANGVMQIVSCIKGNSIQVTEEK